MKKLAYLPLLLWSCNQDNNKTSISYEIEVVKKQYIEINISNNTNKNYFFATPKLYFIKTSNENKNILTEDIITEIKYNYRDFLDGKNSNNIITIQNTLNNNCNSVYLKLKKSENIKLIFKIKNSKDLSSGKYSVIVNDINCNIDSMKKKIPIGYSYYTDSLSIPNKINIQ